MAATARSPFGHIASPSGPSPTTTRSMMRGGLASRSITLVVSTLPSDEPAPPLSEVSAILPFGRHHDIVGPLAGRQIDLAVGHLVAGDIEHRHLVRGKPHRQRALAVRREHHMRDAVGHRDGIGDLDVGAVDRKHADRIVAAVGDQRHLAGRADAQSRRLLAAGDGRRQLGRIGLEIDDVDLVVRHLFQRVAVLEYVDRVRHQRDRCRSGRCRD